MSTPNDELQYPLAVGLYNSEIDRLYTRQSLYVGFQLAAIAGFIASLDKLTAQPVVMRIAIGLMLVLAIIEPPPTPGLRREGRRTPSDPGSSAGRAPRG